MIRDRGYGGSVVLLRRHVATIRPTPREAYLRLETLPGEEAQVDWGNFGTISPECSRGRTRRMVQDLLRLRVAAK